jgi:hypothetical protein
MPHLQSQKGYKAKKGFIPKENFQRTSRPPELARDNLSNAFAGNESNGPSGAPKDQSHSTNVKSRQSKASKAKTPAR